jgi:hypothetical protein
LLHDSAAEPKPLVKDAFVNFIKQKRDLILVARKNEIFCDSFLSRLGNTFVSDVPALKAYLGAAPRSIDIGAESLKKIINRSQGRTEANITFIRDYIRANLRGGNIGGWAAGALVELNRQLALREQPMVISREELIRLGSRLPAERPVDIIRRERGAGQQIGIEFQFEKAGGWRSSICPYCFQLVEWTSGCSYMSHVCNPAEVVSQVRDCYNPPYANYGLYKWCRICGRPALRGEGVAPHAHFAIRCDAGRLPAIGYGFAGDDLERICRGSATEPAVAARGEYQGGRREYIIRLNAMRDVIIEQFAAGRYVLDQDMRTLFARKTYIYLTDARVLGAQQRRAETVWANIVRSAVGEGNVPARGIWDNALPRVGGGAKRDSGMANLISYLDSSPEILEFPETETCSID